MNVEWWAWIALGAGVVTLLVVDLLLFGRVKGVAPSFRSSVLWSIGWTGLGVAFGGLIWAWEGRAPAGEYLAGFLIEKSLSMDNLFVFAMVFAYFAVPLAHQRRVLFWGITGAIVLRAIFILAGAALLDAFHFTIYLFGAILILTGIRMARSHEAETNLAENKVIKLVRRLVPMTDEHEGSKLLVIRAGRRLATPLLAALVAVALFDVLFAVDSIPAIFAVTRDTFIVFAANAFSLLGMTALYFLLAGMMARFRYLNVGLAVILVFVGAKMVLTDVYKIPIAVSLAVIVGVLALSALASALRKEEPPSPPRPQLDTDRATA